MNSEFKQSVQDLVEKTWKEGFNRGVDITTEVHIKILAELFHKGKLSEESLNAVIRQMELEIQRMDLEQGFKVR